MPKKLLPVKDQKAMDAANLAVTTAWTAWTTAYNAAKGPAGGGVVIAPGSTLKTLWDALQTQRAARNTLMDSFRANGYTVN